MGLAIPIEKADAVRMSLQHFMRELEGVPDDHIHNPPELHGSAMLEGVAWATPEHCFRAYAHVVKIVNHHRLRLIRVAYFKKSLAPVTPGSLHKQMIYSLCFSAVQRIIGHLLADSFVVPIMDGLHNQTIARAFAMSNPILHAMRASPSYREGNITIPHVENLMDAVFVDSKYTSIMQVAGVAAYLLQVLDWERQKIPMKEFKTRVVAIAHTLDPELVIQTPEPVWMNHSRA